MSLALSLWEQMARLSAALMMSLVPDGLIMLATVPAYSGKMGIRITLGVLAFLIVLPLLG